LLRRKYQDKLVRSQPAGGSKGCYDVDELIKARSEENNLRFVFADVTVAAKALEARHLSGPTSASVLAESLVAVAMLSADASKAEEYVSLRLHVNGPVQGILVEATGDGGLRGFANVKVMNALDGGEAIETGPALGSSGSVHIVFSVPGGALSRTALSATPPRIKNVVARYYNFCQRIPTGVEICVRSNAGGLVHASGMCVQRLSERHENAFVRALERIEEGAVQKALLGNLSVEALREALEVPGIEVAERRSIRFSCRCTKEKTIAALAGLPQKELEEIVNSGQPQRVFCHMCSRSFTATTDDIRQFLNKKAV
jgi:molecular chaperone Hsp33